MQPHLYVMHIESENGLLQMNKHLYLQWPSQVSLTKDDIF